jgi:hypothetical protein
MDSSVLAFIEGGGILAAQPAFIHTTPTIVGSTGAFISGPALSETIIGAVQGRVELDPEYGAASLEGISYNCLNEYTIAFWIKPNSATPFFRSCPVLFFGNLTAYIPSVANTVRFVLGNNDVFADSPVFVPDKWVYVTATFNAWTGDYAFYWNGTQFASGNEPMEIGTIAGTHPPSLDYWYNSFYLIAEFGPNQPVYGNGSSYAGLKIWNYAKDATEVAELYTTPFIRTAVRSYIEGNPPEEDTVLLRAYISSDSTPSNPYMIFSSIPAEFGIPSEVGSQLAHITAGGEEERVFDTLITVDRKDYRSVDNVIFVGFSSTWLDRSQNGDVTYPITRVGDRRVRVPSQYDPLSETSNLDAWIHTHFEAEATPLGCFIHVGNFVWRGVTAFIPGEYTGMTDSQNCMIVSLAMENTVGCYMDGLFVFDYDWTQRCYLHGYVDSENPTQDIHIPAHDVAESVLNIELMGTNAAVGERLAYITSVMTPAPTFNRSFVRGSTNAETGTTAYIEGVGFEENDQPAYIAAPDQISNSVMCYMGSEFRYRARTSAYLKGLDAISGAQMAYLKADVAEVDNQVAFVQGLEAAFRAKRCHLEGPPVTPMTDSQMAYVVSERNHASQAAYITAEEPPRVLCYVVNVGEYTDSQGAYLAG